MRARKEDKLQRLAEMKAARLLHRLFEGERACELLKGISRIKERERFGPFGFVNFITVSFLNPFHQLVSNTYIAVR